MGAAVELSAVHGWCEDASHPGGVPAKVWKLLVWRRPLQMEAGHWVGGNQTLKPQYRVLGGTDRKTVWSEGFQLVYRDFVAGGDMK